MCSRMLTQAFVAVKTQRTSLLRYGLALAENTRSMNEADGPLPEIQIVWGEHRVYERHYPGTGLDRLVVEDAIRNGILQRRIPGAGTFARGQQPRVNVEGYVIESHPIRRPDGAILVRTHFPIR